MSQPLCLFPIPYLANSGIGVELGAVHVQQQKIIPSKLQLPDGRQRIFGLFKAMRRAAEVRSKNRAIIGGSVDEKNPKSPVSCCWLAMRQGR